MVEASGIQRRGRAIKTYRDLEAWQLAMELVEQVYRLCSELPSNERYGLASQMQRAAVSIPANIAEGYWRGHRREYARFLSIARGSLAELETHTTLAVRLGLVSRNAGVQLWELAQRVGQVLNALLRALRREARD